MPAELPELALESVVERRPIPARRRWRALLLHLVLAAGGATMLLPLVWQLSTSLKPPGRVGTYPPEFIPREQARVTLDGQELDLYEVRTASGWQPVGLVRWAPGAVVVKPLTGPQRGRTVTMRPPSPAELPAFARPVRRVRFVWRNYLDAWRAVTLETRPFAFRVPWVVRIRLFGATYQTKPIAFRGLPIANGFLAWYLNSLYVALIVTLGQVATSALAAFAFARLSFPGRDQLFLGYLGTMMIPAVVVMIPNFILLKKLGLYDTYAALILPVMFTAYGTFMLRQFFLTIPPDLEDAARIDGCGPLGIFRHVILPLSKPALATLTTFAFLHSWNNYMWPLIVTSSPEKKTLPIGLQYFHGQYHTDWHLLMAASIIVMVPVLLVFVFNQRFFVRGIVLTGLKA